MMLVLIVKFLILLAFCDAMTMKQIKSTGKTIRKTCQPKNNAADEKIDPLAKGEFIAEKEVMCYMACVMKMAGTGVDGTGSGTAVHGMFAEARVDCFHTTMRKRCSSLVQSSAKVKNGKISYEAAMKQSEMLLPEEIKEPAKAALTACKKVPDAYKDICEAAFHVTKCIYNHNPDIFYFP